jgi:HD-GYP domain-containing protein (c-di-GMP phosphodiesterase class II)
VSHPPHRAAKPGTPAEPDELLRSHGIELVTLISAVIRIGRAYSVTNQVFRTQLGNIATALRPVLDQSGEAVFVVLNSDLYLNGARIPVNASSFRFHQTVVDAFRSRGISGIRVERAAAVEDLAKFFNLFLQPTCPHGVEMLKACADLNLQRILPAVHASTNPTAASDGDEPWTNGGPAGAEPARRAPAPGGSEDPRGQRSARKNYSHAVQGARSLLTTTALSGGLEMRHAKRVIQPLVDGAFSSEPVVVGLAGLHEHDEYTYSHAVNVCAIAVTMGHFLGMDRRALADLGVAALLHDVGKDAVSAAILHPLEAFTDEERAAAERHPIEGAKLIARTTALNHTTLRCLRVALEHHHGAYPRFAERWNVSLLSQTVALADCYVNLHVRRGDLIEDITPYEALGMVLGPMSSRFEPALLWALVQSVGFYPPGQMIELSDGALALVLAPNSVDVARPHVRIVHDKDGTLLEGEPVELLPIPETMSVKRALRGEDHPREGGRRAA